MMITSKEFYFKAAYICNAQKLMTIATRYAKAFPDVVSVFMEVRSLGRTNSSESNVLCCVSQHA